MLTTPDRGTQYIDFAAAADHLRLLDPQADGFCFLATDDLKQGRQAHTRFGSIQDPDIRDWMQQLQHAGFAIHVTVQEMLGHDRKAENLKRIRVVFAEMDQPQTAPWPVEPSFSISTSPDKWHHYWIVRDMSPLVFKGIMQRMVETYGSDQGVIDYSRVLRLAGTMHMKGIPYRVTLFGTPHGYYSTHDMVSAFPPVVRAPSVPRVEVSGPLLEMQLRQVDEALGLLSQHPDWMVRDVWFQAGCALNHLTEGGERGLQLWIKHSWPGHEGSCVKAWASMTPDKREGITHRTIFALAKPAGWRGSSLGASLGAPAPMPGVVPFLAPAAPDPRLVAAQSWGQDTLGYVPPVHVPVPMPAVMDAAALIRVEAPPREWTVQNWVPHRQVTLVGGDGGVGKTTILIQLALAMGCMRPWLGMMVAPRKVLFVSAEDDRDELHFRVQQVARAMGVDASNVLIMTLDDLDSPELAVADAGGQLVMTPVFNHIVQVIKNNQCTACIMDPASDLFGGNEIDRRQVRAFIGLLRKRIAVALDCTVLLASHPSVDAMKTGRGYSGSTAWNNSVRSRLYFTADSDDDPDERTLTVMKANRARVGAEIKMTWRNGAFVTSNDGTVGEREPMNEAAIDDLFMKILRKRHMGGMHQSPHKSPTFAPVVFEADPDANGVKRGAFEKAMMRLISAQRVIVESYGPPSRRRENLIEKVDFNQGLS